MDSTYHIYDGFLNNDPKSPQLILRYEALKVMALIFSHFLIVFFDQATIYLQGKQKNKVYHVYSSTYGHFPP